MTTPQNPPPGDEVPFSRLLIWVAIALVLILGLWLYVRFSHDVTPLVNT